MKDDTPYPRDELIGNLYRVTPRLIHFIKKWEGRGGQPVLKAYKPLKDDVWTIGWGTTKGVTEGMVITVQDAEEFLIQDVTEFAKKLSSLIKIPLTQSQFDATLSLVYNIGSGNFVRSNAYKFLNSGDLDKFCTAAFDPFTGFVKSGGKIVRGLQNRRKEEEGMFKNV